MEVLLFYVIMLDFFISYVRLEVCHKSLSYTECKTNYYQLSTNCTTLSTDTPCQKTFNMAIIRNPPYDKLFQFLLTNTLVSCCGDCIQSQAIKTFPNTTSFTNAIENKEFVNIRLSFPIVSKEPIGTMVLNKYFIPIILLEGGILFTQNISARTIKASLITSVLNIWPLLFTTLLMALVAGFLGWIMDTWKNEEEFPRPFLRGLFEGFWWSFISMTTVGYGDKSPKSVPARLFSVIWILIGITICSMLTASLTAAINKATNPPEETFTGKKVGVLNDRIYELLFVLKEGGEPEGSNTIEELIYKLKERELDSFFLDIFTALHYQHNLSTFYTTSKKYNGDKIAYGVLVHEKADFDYISPFMRDNSLTLETCILGRSNVTQKILSRTAELFTTDSFYFMVSCATMAGILMAIFIFGLIYEIKRRRKLKKTEIESHTNNGTDIMMIGESELISDVENLVKRWKGHEKHSTFHTNVEKSQGNNC